ncbi:MAG: YcxB family protein [Erysipelotrichaceae bacterium]|nr:YcxB family protein [Erysipelotrichaceae bacterium]
MEENVLFETETVVDYESYVTFCKYVGKNIHKENIKVSLITLFFVLLAITGRFLSNEFSLIFLLSALLFPFAYFYNRKRSIKKNWESSKLLHGSVNVFRFYNDYFEIENANTKSNFKYVDLFKICEDKNNFYLFYSKLQASIIDKKACSEKLIEFISKKVN